MTSASWAGPDRPQPAQRREGRAGSGQRATVGPVIQLCRVRLCPAGRVGEREDDRPLGLGCHLTHDGFGECAGGGGQSEQNPNVDVVYHIGELRSPRQPPASYPLSGLRELALRI